MYPFYFIYYTASILYYALFQLKRTERWATTELHQLEQHLNGKLEPTIFKKVTKYQSIQLHFVADNFTKLEGRVNNQSEQKRNLLFFLMSVLYDQIIDENTMNEAELNQLLQNPVAANPNKFNEIVLAHIHQQLLNEVDDKESYLHALHQTHLAQKESKKQFEAMTPIEEIMDITKRKGGFTLLMCRHYLTTPAHPSIDECWYQLGGLIQMTNDLFDTYKDTQEGINTFANKIKNRATLNDLYHQQVASFNNSIKNLPFSKAQKMEFAIHMSLIPSFGGIAIHQLGKLNTNSDTLPQFDQVNRKALIIDMEKPRNIIRLILLAYKNGKLWM